MSSESDIRSRYLALALDARKLIDSLIVFVDNGDREAGLEDRLQEVIDSLQVAKEAHEVFSPVRSRMAFSEYYEQVRTVEDALSDEQRQEVVEKLAAVRSREGDDRAQRDGAFQAIMLLSAIESRALYYYRPQP